MSLMAELGEGPPPDSNQDRQRGNRDSTRGNRFDDRLVVSVGFIPKDRKEEPVSGGLSLGQLSSSVLRTLNISCELFSEDWPK